MYVKNLGVDLKECLIILVEQLECNNKQELLMRERFYIENNECVNKIKRPIITPEERKEQNNKKQKKYVINNKEKVLEQKNCICGGIYTQKNKKRHEKTNKHLNYLSSLDS